MSEIDTQMADELNDETIAHWLKSHPDFFVRHPGLLNHMNVPKSISGDNIADFQAHMVERLRTDKEKAIAAKREIVETARSNMNNQARMHAGVLRLLEARSFDEFIQMITTDLATILDVDIAALVVEASGHDIPHVHTTGVRVVPGGTIDQWMGESAVLLQSDISGIEAIYGGGAGLVRSQALARVDIAHDTPPAIVAFGSRDPHMFQDGQGTELIAFLSAAVERLFRAWLNLPA